MIEQKRFFIKGFDKKLRGWGGYQFEIGKEYKIELPEGYILSEKDLCTDKVFHFCNTLEKVHRVYHCSNEYHNRFCEIEVLGQFCENENKCGSNHIKIVREIVGEELNILKGLINGNTGLFNIGYCNTGYYNSGEFNTGLSNSGNCNSGDCNSGSCNSGDWNGGDCNSGNCNAGDFNSGNNNKGNYNTGLFNKTSYSSGIFCNVEPKICVFNIQTDWTMSEFFDTKYYQAIISSNFSLTKWKTDYNNTNAKDSLIIHSYEEACLLWWEGLNDKNKAIIKEMPNFDINVFCDITGIPKEQV